MLLLEAPLCSAASLPIQIAHARTPGQTHGRSKPAHELYAARRLQQALVHVLHDSTLQLVPTPVHVNETTNTHAADETPEKYDEKHGNTPVRRFSACEVTLEDGIVSIFILWAVSSVARIASARRTLGVLLGAVFRAARVALVGWVTVWTSAARALAAAKERERHALFLDIAHCLAVLGPDHARGLFITSIALTREPRGTVFLRSGPPDVMRDTSLCAGAAAAHARDGACRRGRGVSLFVIHFAIARGVGAMCEIALFVCASIRIAWELAARLVARVAVARRGRVPRFRAAVMTFGRVCLTGVAHWRFDLDVDGE